MDGLYSNLSLLEPHGKTKTYVNMFLLSGYLSIFRFLCRNFLFARSNVVLNSEGRFFLINSPHNPDYKICIIQYIIIHIILCLLLYLFI